MNLFNVFFMSMIVVSGVVSFGFIGYRCIKDNFIKTQSTPMAVRNKH